MTFRNVFYLSVSLVLSAGIALAQQPTPPAEPAQPDEPFGTFSLLVDGNGFLGVYTEEINKDNLSQYGLREVRGVGVTEVIKDSPAEKAGLRKGDVITRFDGETVNSVRKLNRLVSEVAPDHKVTVGISRGGSEQELAVTIGKRKGTYFDTLGKMTFPFPREDFPKDLPKWENFPQDGETILSLVNNRRIGVSTTALTKQLADFFGVVDGKGVLITCVTENSPAARAGLKAGDVITAVDGEKIESGGDLSRAISKKKDGDVTLTVVRDKNQRNITVTPEKSESQIFKQGRTARNRELRDQIRQVIIDNAKQGRVVIPGIELPSIPPINVTVPQINLPVIPEINIVVPRVRVVTTSRTPI